MKTVLVFVLLLAPLARGGCLPWFEPAPASYGVWPTVAIADFNGDGRVELLTEERIWFPGAAGSFVPGPKLEFPIADQVQVGDVNADGKLDFVSIGPRNTNVVTRYTGLGNGDGTFRISRLVTYYPFVDGPGVLADLDGDGDLDFAAAVGSSILYAAGNGDGTWAPYVALPWYPVYYLTSGDFDGDGRVDLLFTGRQKATIALNRGGLTFDLREVGVNAQPQHAVDLDGDGKDEIIMAASYFQTGYNVLRNRGDATFEPPVFYPTGLQSDGPILDGDFNGDGHRDLLAQNRPYTSATGHNAVLLLGRGDGRLSPPIVVETAGKPVYLGDLNADGLTDITDGSSPRRARCGESRRRSAGH